MGVAALRAEGTYLINGLHVRHVHACSWVLFQQFGCQNMKDVCYGCKMRSVGDC